MVNIWGLDVTISFIIWENVNLIFINNVFCCFFYYSWIIINKNIKVGTNFIYSLSTMRDIFALFIFASKSKFYFSVGKITKSLFHFVPFVFGYYGIVIISIRTDEI